MFLFVWPSCLIFHSKTNVSYFQNGSKMSLFIQNGPFIFRTGFQLGSGIHLMIFNAQTVQLMIMMIQCLVQPADILARLILNQWWPRSMTKIYVTMHRYVCPPPVRPVLYVCLGDEHRPVHDHAVQVYILKTVPSLHSVYQAILSCFGTWFTMDLHGDLTLIGYLVVTSQWHSAKPHGLLKGQGLVVYDKRSSIHIKHIPGLAYIRPIQSIIEQDYLVKGLSRP